MLTTVLLSCVLLLALPVMQGAQMDLVPMEGIRRPDQTLFSEMPGQCGKEWLLGGLGFEFSFSFPRPRCWRWVFHAWDGLLSCPLSQAWAYHPLQKG